MYEIETRQSTKVVESETRQRPSKSLDQDRSSVLQHCGVRMKLMSFFILFCRKLGGPGEVPADGS